MFVRVHGHIGQLQHVFNRNAVAWKEGHAYAGGDTELPVCEEEWFGNSSLQSIAEFADLVLGIAGFDKNCELITAESGDEVLSSQHTRQSLCDPDQRLVTGVVAERIVDMFEAV